MNTVERISDGHGYLDGSVSFIVEGDEGPITSLRLTPEVAGDLIAAICHLVKRTADAFPTERQSLRNPGDCYGPLEISGVGLGPSSDPRAAILIVDLSGISLGFQIPNSELGSLGRAALAMSATVPQA